MGIRDKLAGKLTEDQFKTLRTSFDVVGDIAIIDLPRELEDKGKDIAQALVDSNPSIKRVCSKAGGREGEYRLRKLNLLLGRGTETIHTEHGCRFRVDVRKAYFSPREATERERISRLVKPKERVLVMFSGVGPFGIIIGRKCPDSRVVQVESNPDAVEYADENVRLNRLKYQVENIQGDVRKVVPGEGLFDRVLMPLPETAWQYLDVAFQAARPGGTVHLYGVGEEKNLFRELEERITQAAGKVGRKYRVARKGKVLPFGSRIWKVCIDIEVL